MLQNQIISSSQLKKINKMQPECKNKHKLVDVYRQFLKKYKFVLCLEVSKNIEESRRVIQLTDKIYAVHIKKLYKSVSSEITILFILYETQLAELKNIENQCQADMKLEVKLSTIKSIVVQNYSNQTFILSPLSFLTLYQYKIDHSDEYDEYNHIFIIGFTKKQKSMVNQNYLMKFLDSIPKKSSEKRSHKKQLLFSKHEIQTWIIGCDYTYLELYEIVNKFSRQVEVSFSLKHVTLQLLVTIQKQSQAKKLSQQIKTPAYVSFRQWKSIPQQPKRYVIKYDCRESAVLAYKIICEQKQKQVIFINDQENNPEMMNIVCILSNDKNIQQQLKEFIAKMKYLVKFCEVFQNSLFIKYVCYQHPNILENDLREANFKQKIQIFHISTSFIVNDGSDSLTLNKLKQFIQKQTNIPDNNYVLEEGDKKYSVKVKVAWKDQAVLLLKLLTAKKEDYRITFYGNR